jgi:hypothetical protein
VAARAGALGDHGRGGRGHAGQVVGVPGHAVDDLPWRRWAVMSLTARAAGVSKSATTSSPVSGRPITVTSWVGGEVADGPSPAGQPGERGDNARASYQPLRGDRRRRGSWSGGWRPTRPAAGQASGADTPTTHPHRESTAAHPHRESTAAHPPARRPHISRGRCWFDLRALSRWLCVARLRGRMARRHRARFSVTRPRTGS